MAGLKSLITPQKNVVEFRVTHFHPLQMLAALYRAVTSCYGDHICGLVGPYGYHVYQNGCNKSIYQV